MFKNVKIPKRKSRFLRVGGSVWEFKIDTKRLRKEIKKRYRKKKIENRRQEEHQERQQELQKALTPFDLATRGDQGKGEESSLVARGP